MQGSHHPHLAHDAPHPPRIIPIASSNGLHLWPVKIHPVDSLPLTKKFSNCLRHKVCWS
ncbi:hypothetical protein BDW72DRAFT_163740 [Aspergillus terricola var. indicus]